MRVPSTFSGTALITATVFFAFQIYCDFSGYTDTARGVARMLGFELMRNFDFPYISKTPVEFWQRWHISLSQWFQDYLYFPLAMRYMRQGGWASKYKAHIVAMALIGFWHGANWTFLAFGLYWGVVIAVYLALLDAHAARMRRPSGTAAAVQRRAALELGCRTALMFVIVCIGWVFFRAESIGDAWYVLTHAFSVGGASGVIGRRRWSAAPILWALIVGLCLAEWIYRTLRSPAREARRWPAAGHRRPLRAVRGDHRVRRRVAARRAPGRSSTSSSSIRGPPSDPKRAELELDGFERRRTDVDSALMTASSTTAALLERQHLQCLARGSTSQACATPSRA